MGSLTLRRVEIALQRVVLATFAVACIGLPGCARSNVLRYGVEMRNASSEEINDVSVNFDGFESGGGVLVPGGIKSHEYVPLPVPARAAVVWRSQDGVMHERHVRVPAVSRKYIHDGMLVFTIRDANDEVVEVTAEPAPAPFPK